MVDRIGKRLVRAADGTVNFIIVALLLLMLFIGCYALWDSHQVSTAADSSNWSKYKPTAQAESYSFGELQDMNSEVFAWLTVYGTQIDYPVAQSDDNMKYVNTDAAGKYSLSGCPFLDSDNAKDFSDFDSIVYAHHMETPAMFGELDRFGGKEYFDARKYGNLYCNGANHGIEFFAFLTTDAYDSAIYRTKVVGDASQQAYIDNVYAMAQQSRNIGVVPGDRLIVLSTCSTSLTDGRFILVGRITDTVFDNPFAGQAEEEGINPFLAFLKAIPCWVWALASLFVGLLIVLLVRKRRERKKERIESRYE